MKTPSEQIKELNEVIINSKDPFLIKNWQRSIEILKSETEHGRNNCNDDTGFQGESK